MSVWIIVRKVAGAMLVVAACGTAAYGQFRTAPPASEETPGRLMAILPSHEMQQSASRAQEALKQGRHADAFVLLQRLLDQPEDYFTDQSMEQTLKSQVGEIIAGFTPEQQAAYELLQGSPARKLLEEAQAAGEEERIAIVMRRFPFTAAAHSAMQTIALNRLDQGDVRQAVNLLTRLRAESRRTGDQALELGLREALARQLLGEQGSAAELLFELRPKSSSVRVQIAGQEIPTFAAVDQAAVWLAQKFPSSQPAAATTDWMSPRGSPSGSLAAADSGPIGGPIWIVDPLADLAAELPAPLNGRAAERLSGLLDAVANSQPDSNRLPFCTLIPVITDELVVFRTASDILALDRRTGAMRWRSVLTDPSFNPMWAAESVRQNEADQLPRSGLAAYLRDRLLEDRTYGALSSNGKLLFAIDDVTSTLSPQETRVFNGRRVIVPIPNGELATETFNYLRAYDLAGGRLVWEAGGSRLAGAGEFSGHYFLGPPLPHDGRLYVLAEVQGEIRLLVLEADEQRVRTVWSQPLLAPELWVAQAGERRQMGLMPAVADGMAVCPTGSGGVIGVDLTQRQLRWAHHYPSDAVLSDVSHLDRRHLLRLESRRAGAGESENTWRDGNPLIVDGRILITPIDTDELQCLDLNTGKEVWKAPRDQGLFLAGADAQRVVVVETDRLRGLRLTDGTPVWSDPASFPAPTGRGVWLEDRYLLPLSSGEIATLDLNTGHILARSKLPGGKVAGNLAAGQGALISVSVREALSFRSLPEISTEIAERLKTDSQDAIALGWRGELRLHHREFAAGLEDLRLAIRQSPEPYAKSTLAAALLEGLRVDFDRYRDAIPELESLMDDPQQRQDALWMVARGLEQRGERTMAFARLTTLIESSLDRYTVEHNWQVRNDRRLSGHLARLYAAADRGERQEMDQLITAWLPAASTGAPEEVRRQARRFLRCFDFHPSAVTARQTLVGALDPLEDAVELEMELQRLSRSAAPQVAAPSLARQVRWLLERKRYDDVGELLPEFTARFSEVECEPNTTGQQFAEAIRADESFREYFALEPAWPAGEIRTHVAHSQFAGPPMFRVLPAGPIPPHYRGWSFHTDANATILVAADAEGRQQWRLTHPMIPEMQIFGGNVVIAPGVQRIRLYNHLIAWSTGTRIVVAADLEANRDAPRILWSESLTAANEFAIRPFEGGRYRENLAALTDTAVIYHNGRTLFAADPTTGNLLWSRKDFAAQSAISADAVSVVLSDHDHHLGSSGAVTVIRSTDGAILSRQDAAPTKSVIWRGGGRQLLADDGPNVPRTRLSLRMQDLVAETTVWQTELAASIAPYILTDSELFTVEENRRLTVRNLQTGEVRWSKDIELITPAEALWVQAWKDRYLVTVGKTTPDPETRVMGIDGQQAPIDGQVLAFDRQTGEQLWSTRVEATAYDVTQPAGWPVLAFVGKKIIPPKPLVAPVITRLTATFIDKRTGKVVFSKDETANPNISTYIMQVDPDRNRFVANFLAWTLELHYTGKPAE